PNRLLFLTNTAYSATNARVCFPLRTVAFRGHGFSLLALAKGMSTLFAKNDFSRPSLNYCGLFRHVLLPQDKEGSGNIYIARRKLVCIFEESTVLRSKQPS